MGTISARAYLEILFGFVAYTVTGFGVALTVQKPLNQTNENPAGSDAGALMLGAIWPLVTLFMFGCWIGRKLVRG